MIRRLLVYSAGAILMGLLLMTAGCGANDQSGVQVQQVVPSTQQGVKAQQGNSIPQGWRENKPLPMPANAELSERNQARIQINELRANRAAMLRNAAQGSAQ